MKKLLGIGIAAGFVLAGLGSTWSVQPADAAGWDNAQPPYQHTLCRRASSDPFIHYCP